MRFSAVTAFVALFAVATAELAPIVARSAKGDLLVNHRHVARAAEAPLAKRSKKCTVETQEAVSKRRHHAKNAKQSSNKEAKSTHKSTHKTSSPKKTQSHKTKTVKASSGGGGTDGSATWFTQDGTEGACQRGKVSDSAKVVAMCPSQYRSMCGKTITITDTTTGKTVEAIGNDECPECACDHLDLSLGAYDALGQSRDVGVLKIKFTLG